MGRYVSPTNCSKETWLKQNAIALSSAPVDFNHDEKKYVPVCLVDNGAFTAAAIAFCLSEMEYFKKDTSRPKQWFMANRDALVRDGFLPE